MKKGIFCLALILVMTSVFSYSYEEKPQHELIRELSMGQEVEFITVMNKEYSDLSQPIKEFSLVETFGNNYISETYPSMEFEIITSGEKLFLKGEGNCLDCYYSIKEINEVNISLVGVFKSEKAPKDIFIDNGFKIEYEANNCISGDSGYYKDIEGIDITVVESQDEILVGLPFVDITY